MQTESKTEKLIEPGNTDDFENDIQIYKPNLWSTDSPVLYKAVTEIMNRWNRCRSIRNGIWHQINFI